MNVTYQVHNAALNNIGTTQQDFNNLASMFEDSSWSYTNMRKYFVKIEDDLSLTPPNADHGFKGWLGTTLNPPSILSSPPFTGASHWIQFHALHIYVLLFRRRPAISRHR